MYIVDVMDFMDIMDVVDVMDVLDVMYKMDIRGEKIARKTGYKTYEKGIKGNKPGNRTTKHENI